jgi:hypothetical protein
VKITHPGKTGWALAKATPKTKQKVESRKQKSGAGVRDET